MLTPGTAIPNIAVEKVGDVVAGLELLLVIVVPPLDRSDVLLLFLLGAIMMSGSIFPFCGRAAGEKGGEEGGVGIMLLLMIVVVEVTAEEWKTEL
jgi:hypothetical protein